MSSEIDDAKIALRVLAAVIDKKLPDAGDVELLRKIAPELADGPVDQLACHVIRISIAALDVPCPKCQRIGDEVAYAERVHGKALARLSASMSGPFETYLGFRDAESKAGRELELARNRLREHQRTHRRAAE